MSKHVAVKVLRSNYQNDPTFHSRFIQEGQILSRLDHPNILKVYSSGLTDASSDRDSDSKEDSAQGGLYATSGPGDPSTNLTPGRGDTEAELTGEPYPYLVMEYIQGQSIDELVAKNGPFSINNACMIIAQIADALHTAHQMKIVHRDIKPSNILVSTEGIPFLLDFGLGKIASEQGGQRLTATAQLIGTPAYMSPEQSTGKPATPFSDQYSLACVLYFMCTAEQLFNGNSDLEVMLKHSKEESNLTKLDASRELKAVLQKALSKNEANRFSDMGEFEKALRSADKSTIQARAKGELKHKLLSVRAFVILLVVMLSAAGFAITKFKRSRSFAESNEEARQSRQKKSDWSQFEKACLAYNESSDEKNKDAEFQKIRNLLESETCKNDVNLHVSILEILASSTGQPELGIPWSKLELKLVKSPQFTLEGKPDHLFRAYLNLLLNYKNLDKQFAETQAPIEEWEKSVKNIDDPNKEFAVMYFKSYFLEKLKLNNQAIQAEKTAMLFLKKFPMDSDFPRLFFYEIPPLRVQNDPNASLADIADSLCHWLERQAQASTLTDKDISRAVSLRNILESTADKEPSHKSEAKRFFAQVFKIAVPKSESPEIQFRNLNRFCRGFFRLEKSGSTSIESMMDTEWAMYFKKQFPLVLMNLDLNSNPNADPNAKPSANPDTVALLKEDFRIIFERLKVLGKKTEANEFLQEMSAAGRGRISFSNSTN